MDAQVQERDVIEAPTVNPWRRPPTPPTREQVRFATDLCRSELPYADRTATVRSFATLDIAGMSELIEQLKDARARRLARLRGSRRRRR
jgi:hypothetical protein